MHKLMNTCMYSCCTSLQHEILVPGTGTWYSGKIQYIKVNLQIDKNMEIRRVPVQYSHSFIS